VLLYSQQSPFCLVIGLETKIKYCFVLCSFSLIFCLCKISNLTKTLNEPGERGKLSKISWLGEADGTFVYGFLK